MSLVLCPLNSSFVASGHFLLEWPLDGYITSVVIHLVKRDFVFLICHWHFHPSDQVVYPILYVEPDSWPTQLKVPSMIHKWIFRGYIIKVVVLGMHFPVLMLQVIDFFFSFLLLCAEIIIRYSWWLTKVLGNWHRAWVCYPRSCVRLPSLALQGPCVCGHTSRGISPVR